MKNILILFLLSPISLLAQVFPIKENKVIYEYVFINEGKSKDDLYAASAKFFVDNFNNSNYVIKSQDKDLGQVIGKGFMNVSYFKNRSILGSVYPFNFTVKTDVKDGKARIQIYDIYRDDNTIRSGTIEEIILREKKGTEKSDKKLANYDAWANHINDHFLSIIALYKRAIESASDDNW